MRLDRRVRKKLFPVGPGRQPLRETYVKDQAAPNCLITASDRSKADNDPAERLPSDGSYH